MSSESPLVLGLDVTSLIGAKTGVGALTSAIVDGIAPRSDVAVRPFAVTLRGRKAAQLRDGPLLASRPMAARPLRWMWSHWNAPAIEFWTGPIDVVHGPNFVVPPTREAAQVVTVHDLTAWRFPELVSRDSSAYPQLVGKAIESGAWIHTPSRFVACEVIDELHAPPERVVSIANGAPALSDEGPGTDSTAGRALAGCETYILAVGTVEPRKDLPGLVAAFDAVANQLGDVKLVLAGPDGWGAEALTDAISRSHYSERIIRLGWVDDAARSALLRGASVVAYPSVYEGFGLVPLEAMVAGVPVISTRTGAIPEVVGDAATLVEPGDTDALAAGIIGLITDESKRSALIAAGHLRRARFSWDSAVDEFANLYRAARDSR